MASSSHTPRPVMLVILDGFGWREDSSDNAVRLARTPNFDRLWEAGPHSFLDTSGSDVGLPDGQMGNSEVGHLNIGAGRIVMQELQRIGTAIKDGSLAANPVIRDFTDTLKKTGGTCHLMGLVSPGGVHSHQNHAIALAKIVSDAGVPVAFHIFTDGRDTPPESATEYLREVAAALPAGVKAVTISGRYYAMDRDNRWERVSKVYNLLTAAEGPVVESAEAALKATYAAGKSDEFVEPALLDSSYTGMKDGDGILSFNFRADRIRQLLDALLDPEFQGFERRKVVKFSSVITMTRYSDHLARFVKVIFAPQTLTRLLGEVVADAGKTQLRMAETEKYPHVTYFLNGGRETQFQGEDRILVPSPKVATYDLQPEMSAPELTDKAVAAIESGQYDMIVLNYANPDMVGHTGILEAAIKAVETVDTGLGRLADAVHKQGGVMLVTADHGNCETMTDPETGEPHTAHTTNHVPFILTNIPGTKIRSGRLSDLAPTMLDLMGVPQPEEMTGRSLITSRG